MRILICEDDPDIAEILDSYLRGRGYETKVIVRGDEAVSMFRSINPDLVLLDILLPELDGWEVLAQLRELSDVPIILITALGRVDDKIRGLSGGADDFITKPFVLREVEARIEAILRRNRPQIGRLGLAIDDARKSVTVHGEEIQLSPKEYLLLTLLTSEAGRVFSNEEIRHRLWPSDHYASEQDVQKYVYLLRKKLEADPSAPKILLTVRGFGYRVGV